MLRLRCRTRNHLLSLKRSAHRCTDARHRMTARPRRVAARQRAVIPVSRLVSQARLLLERQLRPDLGQRRDLGFHARRVGTLLLQAQGREGAGALRDVPAARPARSRSRCGTGCASKCAPRRRSTSRAASSSSTSTTVRLAGLGALYERFARLKARLEAAGWFEACAQARAAGVSRAPWASSPRRAPRRCATC